MGLFESQKNLLKHKTISGGNVFLDVKSNKLMQVCTQPFVYSSKYITAHSFIKKFTVWPTTLGHCLLVMVQHTHIRTVSSHIPPWSHQMLFLCDLNYSFCSSSLLFLFLQTLSPSGPGQPLSVWGSKKPAGMTFSLSSNLKFSSRFLVELLDSFLRPSRPIIIWLGLSRDHCLLSLGSL